MLVSLKSIEVFFAKLHYAIIAPGRRLLAPILHRADTKPLLSPAPAVITDAVGRWLAFGRYTERKAG